MFTQIITHTPLWVWALLAFLVTLGWSQTRDREVSLKRATILPVVMIIFSASSVLQNKGNHLQLIVTWIIACVLVAAWVMRLPLNQKTHYKRDTGTLQVAGSWIPMVLILTIFIGKYALAIFTALQAEQAHSITFTICSTLFFGSLSGIFLGRTARLWRIATNAKQQPLAQSA
ncbi:hypothetical protein H8K35_11305 [Undibacterium sp. LX40W]|uniref:Transmembrane protein n=2 Tax=Oxalobacteraceae TaxID=75682 RepID=A0A923HPX3_9BURK|nr:DUF6622 family protein [Undibacterium sp. LX40W]MBC3881753.1 hypothetical protein [Undibacterium nitidum]MBC3892250.1 hypothetical protein [Undibacterium sp. LX40W]